MRSRLTIALALALAAAPVGAVAPATAATDLLPDLQMSQVYNVQIERTGAGRKRLRFGTIVWNVGNGPLEVRAGDRVDRTMHDVTQWIRTRGGGGYGYKPPGATAFYSGDGHDHWHIQSFVVISLFPAPGTAVAEATLAGPTFSQRSLRKIGFCLTDLVRAPASLRPPASERRIRFPVSGCGTLRDTSVRMGISVGFGDDYKPFFNHQAVDITGLVAGTYRLCATVNSNAMWREMEDNAANNSTWVDMELDAAASRFEVVGMGDSDCQLPAPMVFGVGG